MIDIDFKHGCPEEVWFTRIDPDNGNDKRNLLSILNNIEQVKNITVSRISRYVIVEQFRNLPVPNTMPTYLFFTGDFARQIVGQLITMALSEEPFLMGYFPLKK
jgi:hypothetical protein